MLQNFENARDKMFITQVFIYLHGIVPIQPGNMVVIGNK